MIEKRRNLVFRFLPGLFLSGLLLLSGCSQDDVSDVPAGSRAIGFRAQGAMSSLKATTTGAEHIQSFVVSANHGGDWTAADDYLISAATVYRQGGGDPDAAASWTYSPQAYFPTDKSSFVEFLAYSPAVSKNVTAGLKDADDADQTITYTVPKPLATGLASQEDFLVAYQKVNGTGDPDYGDPVSLQFRHALSRVLVAAASSLTEPVTVTGLVLHNLYTTGDLPMNSASTVWTPDPAKLDNYSYILPPAGVSVTQYPASQPAPSPLPLVTSNEQGMFVLPQTTPGDLLPAASDTINEFYLEIKYSIGGLSKEPHYIQFGDLVAPTSGTGVTFEPGKQYVLNLTFGSGSGTGGGGGSDQPSVDIGATISFGELGVDGYGPDITVPKPPVFEPVAVVWSQSNVYFVEESGDEGWLTFDESNSPDHNLYQGVYFKWGSLIGVSAGASYTGFSSSSLFIPDLSTGKYHRVAVSALDTYDGGVQAVNDFKTALTNLNVSDFTDYNDIYAKLPYVTQADMTGDVPVNIPTLSGADYRDDNGLTAASGTALYSTYRGDICKYLADKNSASGNSLTKGTWRLPTSREFGNGGTNNSDGTSLSDPAPGDYDTRWNKDESASGTFAADINGAGELDKNGTQNWYYTLVRWIFDPVKDNLSTAPSFPASGLRGGGNGFLDNVGSIGFYWSSSVSNDAAYVLYLNFNSGNVNPYNGYSRTLGCSVRCVRDGENVAP